MQLMFTVIDHLPFFVQTCIQKEVSLHSFCIVLLRPYASLGKSKKYPIIFGKRARHSSIDFWQKRVVY